MATNHFTATGNYQNLFVAKLPLSVTDAELMTVFAQFKPSNATVMLDPVTGRSKGYAFVLFPCESNGRDAAAALDKQSATVTRESETFTFDLTLFASKHSGKEVAVENECLYIRNIPNSWPMAAVESFIAQHGKPVFSAVRSDHLGSPVWVVFVEYDSIESARKTLKAVHGMVITPRSPPILAKFAENEDVKRNRRDRKMGRSRRQPSADVPAETKAPTISTPAPVDEVPTPVPMAAAVCSKRRIDVSHQMHHPCHATRYDNNGSRVNAAAEEQQAQPSTTVNTNTACMIPRPRSAAPLSTPTTAKPAAMAIPVPRSKQNTVPNSPTTANPAALRGTASPAEGHSFRKASSVAPLSGADSSHYISSSSASSSSSKADDTVAASAATRFRFNPYSYTNVVPCPQQQ